MNPAPGYANELYDRIAAFGLRRGAQILDVACRDGIASEPFALNGFTVTGVDASPEAVARARERVPSATFVEGKAEALPFPQERFDLALSAHAFHLLDRAAALLEIHRVVRPGGSVAIWWRTLMSQDPVKEIREQAFSALGKEPPPGFTAGFKEFYAAPLVEQTVRVIPWRTAMPLDRLMQLQRSHARDRAALGTQAAAYDAEVEARLHERFGTGNPSIPLAYNHYLYLAKRA